MLPLLTIAFQLYYILDIFKALDVLRSSGGHTTSLSHLVLISKTCFLTRYYLVLVGLCDMLVAMVSELLYSISLFFLFLGYISHLKLLV